MTENFEYRRQHASRAMIIGAIIAWCGVLLTNLGNIFDWFPRESGKWPGLYGHSLHGMAGAGQRFIEGMSYFTMVSNILVAVMFTLLAVSSRKTLWRVVLCDTALMMITVTSLVFLTVILPYLSLSRLSLLTSPWQHVVVPMTMWIIWLVWGPRNFFGGFPRLAVMIRTVLIPAIWAAWMLTYGAITHYYPYGFVNVNELGYAGVLVSLVIVMAGGLVMELLFGWIDSALNSMNQSRKRKND